MTQAVGNVTLRQADEAAAAAEVAPGRPMRVTMLGLRGFPGVQGGVENHVQNLALELVTLGCSVEVIVRSSYMPDGPDAPGPVWRGIRLVRLWAPRVMGVEAFLHTLLGVMRAVATRPDVIHIHAIGPALFAPLVRLAGLKVVVTHHGPNYENEKWGAFGRSLLRFGERVGMRLSHARIAVSASLAERMQQSHRVAVAAIPNGIPAPRPASPAPALPVGLVAGRYVLCVARIDQQKRQLDLIAAWERARPGPGWMLALAGAADYNAEYAQEAAQAAARVPGVALLGRQDPAVLADLYHHAAAFVLPSGHEGQPIAVLEAISYGCPLILSDIPPHREVAPDGTRFCAPGDVAALAGHLAEVVAEDRGAPPRLDDATRARVAALHDWAEIARRTLTAYRGALGGGGR